MEDIGDIKAMRKNLMIVSLSVLALIFFASDISEINLWLVKFKEGAIFGIKNILLFMAILSYTLWRYWQYLRNARELRHWDMRNFWIYLIQQALKKDEKVRWSLSFWNGRHAWRVTLMEDDWDNVFIQSYDWSWCSFNGLRRDWKLTCSISLKDEWQNEGVDGITWEDRYWWHANDDIHIYFGNDNADGGIDGDEVHNCDFNFKCRTSFVKIRKALCYIAHVRFWDYILPILLGIFWIIGLALKLIRLI